MLDLALSISSLAEQRLPCELLRIGRKLLGVNNMVRTFKNKFKEAQIIKISSCSSSRQLSSVYFQLLLTALT